jgi:hypothetical protein
MAHNLCHKKSVKNPNKCKKVRGCKVANGTKRTYCRKTKNKKSGTKKAKTSRKTVKRRSEVNRLKGLGKKTIAALKKLA